MKRTTLFAAVLSPVMAGLISSEATCRVQGLDSITNQSSCIIDAELGYTRATAEMLGDFGVAAFTSSAYGSSLQHLINDISASAEISRTESFLSEGPVRQGFALVNWGVLRSCSPIGTNYCSGRLQVGEHILAFTRWDYVCSFGPCGDVLLPITLGSPIEVLTEISALAFAGASAGQGRASAYASADIRISLFEQDRQTPVAWTHMPEPATWGLIALGLAIIVVRRRNND